MKVPPVPLLSVPVCGASCTLLPGSRFPSQVWWLNYGILRRVGSLQHLPSPCSLWDYSSCWEHVFSLTDSNRMGLEERVLLPLWGSSKAQHCLRLGSKPNSEIHHQKVHCSLTRCQPSCQAILEFGWKYTLFSSRQAGMYLGVVTRSRVCGCI